MRARLLVLVGLSACAPSPVVLHAPTTTPAAAREPTKVELEPIALAKRRDVVAAPGPIVPADPAMILTAGIVTELGARALHGGEPGGYVARCTLDRFALRNGSSIASLYVDLSCTVERGQDHAPVWRGELRGRAATTSSGDLEPRNARLVSDASREIASDLAVRVLGLAGSPSARVFPDEAGARTTAGVDDAPTLGPLALADSPDGVQAALGSLKKESVATRAAAWNVVAMGSSPGDPWLAGPTLALDDEPWVRFYQYKSLARLGSHTSLGQLQRALAREDDPVLIELVRDSIASGGVGVPRAPRESQPSGTPATPNPATSGSTTSP